MGLYPCSGQGTMPICTADVSQVHTGPPAPTPELRPGGLVWRAVNADSGSIASGDVRPSNEGDGRNVYAVFCSCNYSCSEKFWL